MKSAVPDMFRKKTKPLYKDSLLGTVIGISGLIAVGVFIIAVCYYALILEPSPETTMFDCGGNSCLDLYYHLSGCKFPDVYNGAFKLIQPSWEEGDAKYASAGEIGIFDSSANPGVSTTATASSSTTSSTTTTSPSVRRFLNDPAANCQPKDGGSYFIIAGQHSGAENSLENILVRLKYARTDPFSVLNLSWTTATLAWTFMMTGFSLVLPYLGDRFMNPEALSPSVPKEVEIVDKDDVSASTENDLSTSTPTE